MLKAAIDVEVNEFVSAHSALKLDSGHQQVVRNSYLPTRAIQTGIGQVNVTISRVRDRGPDSKERIQFTTSLIPTYMRRTLTLDVLLPLLYLKGISTGDFQTTLEPRLGKQAKSISPNVISRLKASWYDDYRTWQSRDLSDKHYVYWWVDGIYLKARMESDKTCLLVIIGANKDGRKEPVAFIDGFRESKESWLSLRRYLQKRGLKQGPVATVGDGALGFWGALEEVYPKTKVQRCWVHKTANVLNKLPKSIQAKAKSDIHDIYLAATLTDAQDAWQQFIEQYQHKYPKATQCLQKDKTSLLTFYQFPAEHRVHLRTTNPIESTFATVRHRTKKSKNCFSRKTIIASVLKLLIEAQKRWRYLNGRK